MPALDWMSIWDVLKVNVSTPRCLISVSRRTDEVVNEGLFCSTFLLLFTCSRVITDPG
jgi:hypothetical protein